MELSGLEEDMSSQLTDTTVICSGATNVSVGQRQRLNLARGIYKILAAFFEYRINKNKINKNINNNKGQQKIYVLLLDDPFCSIDSVTSKQIAGSLFPYLRVLHTHYGFPLAVLLSTPTAFFILDDPILVGSGTTDARLGQEAEGRASGESGAGLFAGPGGADKNLSLLLDRLV